MPIIELEITIAAPIERVFDLSRSVELHVQSTAWTRERAVGGVTTGLLGPGDRVTWEALHLGVRQRLTSEIVAFDRPHHFRDAMVRGAFRRFDHDHFFRPDAAGTRVGDRFDFESPLGPLGRCANTLVLTRYMRRFLARRLDVIKRAAESDEWRRYLPAP